MTDRANYFARARDRVDEPLLREKLVVIVGVGSVGSQIAEQLAKSGVGRLVLIDGGALREVNLLRHALTEEFAGANKAVATTAMLRKEVPDLDVRGLGRDVDASMPEGELDRLIGAADLLVATTDDVAAQRYLAYRALAFITPAILPGVYPERGGEVFVQRQPGRECYHCYDAFREPSQRLREAAGINLDVLLIVQLAVRLSLGLLDASSREAGLLHGWEPPYPPLPTLFIQRPTHIELPTVPRRPGCPSCGAPEPDLGQVRSALEEVAVSQQQPQAPPERPKVFTGLPEVVGMWLAIPLFVGGCSHYGSTHHVLGDTHYGSPQYDMGGALLGAIEWAVGGFLALVLLDLLRFLVLWLRYTDDVRVYTAAQGGIRH